MKTRLALAALISTVVVTLSISPALCRAGSESAGSQNPSAPAVVDYRQFARDAVDGKLGTNDKLDSFTVSMMIVQRLDKNEACQAYLRSAAKGCFEALPISPYRSSDSPLNWDEAKVTNIRIGTKGGSVALRVKSQDGKDEFLIRTMGGTKQCLAWVENVSHRHSSSLATTEQIASFSWATSAIPKDVAAQIATNLFNRLIADRGYQPIELCPPNIYVGPKVWLTRGAPSEFVRANSETVRYPYWSAEFSDAKKTHIARLVFTRSGSDKDWVPMEIGFDGYPSSDEERPLIELADAFLEPGWDRNVHETFSSLSAEGVSDVANKAMSQIHVGAAVAGE